MKVEVLGNREGRLCVYNCLDTDRGLEIASDMLEWLKPIYCVHVVHHDGSKFEHEGIAYMKELVVSTGKPCLYLHTKSACHGEKIGRLVRNMWRGEFSNPKRYEEYFKAVAYNYPAVACPISGPTTRLTRYNGFVVNAKAMERVDLSYVHDRLWYECMWNEDFDTDIRVMKYWGSLKRTHEILKIEFNE